MASSAINSVRNSARSRSRELLAVIWATKKDVIAATNAAVTAAIADGTSASVLIRMSIPHRLPKLVRIGGSLQQVRREAAAPAGLTS
ncbi:MAG: hypothetical protein QOE48_4071 [Mycobacterium sp.]|jgi:hypothetical protein|nr:hypothetical protein [Mycobacterium sp.]